MKILCAGDLHLGRRSSRLPRRLDGRAHSAAGGWERIVDLALREGVDVVALSGDLVDRENRFYEAVGPLEAGLRRLAAAGITTVAVTGNHDFDVLPRLADSLASGGSGSDTADASGSATSGPAASGSAPLRLLGRGGVWERATIRRGDRVVHLDGWSFPSQYVRESPLSSYELPVPDDGVVLGLLHADLEQPGSPYAPVLLPELRARPVDFWLLGHIHAPYLHEGAGLAPVLYPGSPQALDPGERGAHGAWIVTIEPGRRFGARFVPLSTVRYDEVVIDLTGAADTGEVDGRVLEGVRAHLAALEDDGVLRCVSCRLRVVGRTAVHRQLASHLENLTTDLALSERGMTGLAEKVEVATRPAYELAELARGGDPVGVLARILVGLEGGAAEVAAEGAGSDTGAPTSFDDEEARLLRDAERAAAEVARARAYLALGDGGVSDRHGGDRYGGNRQSSDFPWGDRAGDSGPARSAAAPGVAHQALAHQASLLLDLLLAQKEEG